MRGSELGRRRRGLDPEAALPRAPEKAGHVADRSRRPAAGRARSSCRPAHLRSTASTGQSTTLSNRSIAVATSISSGAASHGSRRDLVVRAEPDRPVALALEIEAAVGVVDQRQVLEARLGRLAAGPSSGAWAQCRAAATPQRSRDLVGPGARRIDEDRRGELSIRPPASTVHRRRSTCALDAGARRSRSCPPRRRNCRRKAACKAGDVDVGAARLEQRRASSSAGSPDQSLELVALDALARSTSGRQLGPVAPATSGARRASRRKPRSANSAGGLVQEVARRGGQLRDDSARHSFRARRPPTARSSDSRNAPRPR